jgi:hypothetical protein
MSVGQPGSGSPWSLFEDQVGFPSVFFFFFEPALSLVFKILIKYLRLFFLLPQALVVLVHDMGPNWELISDAINSTAQFKVNKIISSIDSLLV